MMGVCVGGQSRIAPEWLLENWCCVHQAATTPHHTCSPAPTRTTTHVHPRTHIAQVWQRCAGRPVSNAAMPAVGRAATGLVAWRRGGDASTSRVCWCRRGGAGLVSEWPLGLGARGIGGRGSGEGEREPGNGCPTQRPSSPGLTSVGDFSAQPAHACLCRTPPSINWILLGGAPRNCWYSCGPKLWVSPYSTWG